MMMVARDAAARTTKASPRHWAAMPTVTNINARGIVTMLGILPLPDAAVSREPYAVHPVPDGQDDDDESEDVVPLARAGAGHRMRPKPTLTEVEAFSDDEVGPGNRDERPAIITEPRTTEGPEHSPDALPPRCPACLRGIVIDGLHFVDPLDDLRNEVDQQPEREEGDLHPITEPEPRDEHADEGSNWGIPEACKLSFKHRPDWSEQADGEAHWQGDANGHCVAGKVQQGRGDRVPDHSVGACVGEERQCRLQRGRWHCRSCKQSGECPEDIPRRRQQSFGQVEVGRCPPP